MKAFIQYLDYDNSGKVSAPCGDRCVIILDGRIKLESMVDIAVDSNGVNRPKYPFFEIRAGDFKQSEVIYSNRLPDEISESWSKFQKGKK